MRKVFIHLCQNERHAHSTMKDHECMLRFYPGYKVMHSTLSIVDDKVHHMYVPLSYGVDTLIPKLRGLNIAGWTAYGAFPTELGEFLESRLR